MGWDGVCVFEEKVGGHWLPLGEVDIQVLSYYVARACDAPFIQQDADEQTGTQQSGTFLWHEFVTASNEDADIGSFRTIDEVMERIRTSDNKLLKKALATNIDQVRATILIAH